MYSGVPHLEFALSEQFAELSDAFCSDGVALWLVLGHLVLQSDEADGRALLFPQAKELQDSLVVVNVAVDEDEQDLDRRERAESVNDFTQNSPTDVCVRVYTGTKSQD